MHRYRQLGEAVEGVQMSQITIVGCGPGSREYASQASFRAIADADLLVGAQRLLDDFGECKNSVPYTSVAEILQVIRDNRKKNVAVLVTGDPGFYSITALVTSEFPPPATAIIPGISSMTYAFSKLGLMWHDTVFISAHKEMPENFAQIAAASRKLGILTSPRHTVARCAAALKVNDKETWRFYVGTRLSYPDEQLGEYSFDEVCEMDTGDLSVLLLIKKDLS